MKQRLSSRQVVLLGIGHTNAHVLRMWKMNPLPDTALTCISDHTIATYSGMLPAALAGQIPREEMEIDLVRLCSAAGARLITDRVTGIDQIGRTVQFSARPSVPFDVLSIGIGSRAAVVATAGDSEMSIQIKPMQSFMDRLESAVVKAVQRRPSGKLNVCIIGGGVASVEIAFCLPAFLDRIVARPVELCLITRSSSLLAETLPGVQRRVNEEFARRGVSMVSDADVISVDDSGVTLSSGEVLAADMVIWATSAAAPPLTNDLGLQLDDRGFVAVDRALQSVSAAGVFAVGDTGSIVGESLPKAGVYAVRQGPILWENMQRYLDKQPLRQYRPQRSFLKLINRGDGHAIGQWKGLAFSGRWALSLKHHIDSKFMRMFAPNSTDSNSMEMSNDEMQCRGCGCKLGTATLEAGLPAVGVKDRNDAASVGDDQGLVASTDFFTSPLDDMYLSGRIAALHSASDIVASGARPTEALANIVLPEGPPEQQQRALADFAAGAEREFDQMGARIVGGHTIVGPRLEVGFTVIGKLIGSSPICKSNLRPGDRLFLSKPIGVGVLLAAHMRAECPALAYEALVAEMLKPLHQLGALIPQTGITAATDVTGFGLAGHLIEMLTASDVSARLSLADVPLLPSVADLIDTGVESTLAPENRAFEKFIQTDTSLSCHSTYSALFDPQTCGGLLIGVSAEKLPQFESLTASDPLYGIGVVGDAVSDGKPLIVVG